ncbi:MAG TPA: hypothetical protein VN605_05475, partial [Thermoanaerobaculia bacterium]|nr:hypothetical protein [Thermoanaerobaculia bacterium]
MTTPNKRLIQIFAFLAAWAVVVVARLVQIQLVRHGDYTIRAQRQQERTLSLNPLRGSILDSRGRVLAESVSAETIYADPQAIPDIRKTARALGSMGVGDADDIAAKLRGRGSFVYIARQVPMDDAAKIKRLKLPGIYF